MQPYLLLTVDCDLRMASIFTRTKALDTLINLFEQFNIQGKATWFLNENHFFITENHELFLHKIAQRRDTIGIHDHVDLLDNKDNEIANYEFCKRSLNKVNIWLKKNFYTNSINCHRMGCLYQREVCYKALSRLGYTIISDAVPGDISLSDHVGDFVYDNRYMPDALLPFFHDYNNYCDHSSTVGHFLNFPIFHMSIVNFNFKRLEKWIQISKEKNYDLLPIVWLFHPYEICSGEGRNYLDEIKITLLQQDIERLISHYQLTPIGINECSTFFYNTK